MSGISQNNSCWWGSPFGICGRVLSGFFRFSFRVVGGSGLSHVALLGFGLGLASLWWFPCFASLRLLFAVRGKHIGGSLFQADRKCGGLL